jgi:electron transfer flavoprotein beta subunit
MNVIVCVKRVPDLAEAEVQIDRSGRAIRTDDLEWGINEWDNYAVEAAVRLKEAHGGKVTALTVGGDDDEEVLRRALAMGADQALRLADPAFADSDALGLATVLAHACRRQPFDLVLTGAVSADDGRGHVGGMLAALLDLPHVALATALEVSDGKARVRHEVEGGLERLVALDLPALVTVQTGINEPRYVSIRGIRKVAQVAIPVLGAAELGIDPATVGAAAARVVTEELSLPPRGQGAEMLEGSHDEVVAALVERLRERGVI